MADSVINTINDGVKLVKLIRDYDDKGVNSVEIVNLLSKDIVNKQVNGIPLILFYLKTTRHLDIGVLEAFVNYGCDLNVQDSRGKTPLHWLVGYNSKPSVGQTVEQLVSLVELFISNGANPCLVDNDYSNVLMMGLSSYNEDWRRLIKLLIVNPWYTRQLLDGTNRLGFSFMTLCRESDCLETVLLELKSIAEELDTNKVDDNGNNLHNLFSKSTDKNQPTVHLTEHLMINELNGRDELPEQIFKRYLEYLVESGANVSQKNNDGLVPLQVALLSYKRLRTCRPPELKSLVPSMEVLSGQVPWPSSLVSLILNNYQNALVPFLKELVNTGLDCSHEQTLPTVLNLECCQVQVFSILVEGGARATINCIKEVLEGIDMLNGQVSDNDYADMLVLCILLKDGLPDDLVILLDDAIPDLVKFLIRCNNPWDVEELLMKLLERGLGLKIGHIRMALAKGSDICIKLLDHVSPEVIIELNAECPSVFEQLITSNGNLHSLFAKFVGVGVHVTVDTVLKLFDSKNDIRHVYDLVVLMTEEVEGQLKEALPNAISHLIEVVTNNDELKRHERFYFDKLAKHLVTLGFKATIHDLVHLFDAHLSFSTLLLLVNTVDAEVKCQITIQMSDAIGKLISNYSRWGVDDIDNCFALIGSLVSLGVKIEVADLKHGMLIRYGNVTCFPMPCLIRYLDNSLKDEIQHELPDLLLQVFGLLPFLTYEYYGDNNWLIETVTVLMAKFSLDINYSNVAQDTFLHVLIRLCSELPFHRKELMHILNGVLSRPELDLDKVGGDSNESSGTRREVHVRPIDLAIRLKHYELVNILIFAGAKCDGLDLTTLKDDQLESLNTAKLLYITGHYPNFYGNEALSQWIGILPVRSLLELAALAVRKNTSRTELNDIANKFVFPQTVLNYFILAHVQLECGLEEIAVLFNNSRV